MKRAEKPFFVEDLAAQIKDAKSTILVNYQGLAIKQLSDLRSRIAEAGGKMLVAKNTLIKLALEEAGVKDDQVNEYLTGPSAVILSQEDEIAPLQALGKFITENDLPELKFGIFNASILDKARLLALSKLPGRDTLLGQVVGTVSSPIYGLVGTLQGNLAKLVYVLNAKASQQG